MVPEVHQVHLGHQDKTGREALLAHRVKRVVLETWAREAAKVTKVAQVQKDVLVQMVQQGLQVNVDHLERPEKMELMDYQVRGDLRDHQVHLENAEKMEIVDLLAEMDIVDHLERMVIVENRVQEVIAVHVVTMDMTGAMVKLSVISIRAKIMKIAVMMRNTSAEITRTITVCFIATMVS